MSVGFDTRLDTSGAAPEQCVSEAGSPACAGFSCALVAIALLSTALLFWLIARGGFVVSKRAIAFGVAPGGLMAGLFAFYRYSRNEPVFAHIFWALGLMTFISYVDGWLAIVGLASGFPLQDTRLMEWSKAVGVDYRVLLGMVAIHPGFGAVLDKAYMLSVPTMFLAPVILSATHEFERLTDFVRLYVVLLTACVVVSIVLPAKGFALYDPLPADIMMRLPTGASVFYAKAWEAYRSGALRVIDPSLFEGVVVFPSFHTIMALLAIFAFWRTPFLWLPSLVVNMFVLLSVVPIGGHYIWDVALAALMFATALGLQRRQSRCRFRFRPIGIPSGAVR